MPHLKAPGQRAPTPEETGVTLNGSSAIVVEHAALGRDFQQQLAAPQAALKSSSTSESPMHPVASPENTSMSPHSNGNVYTPPPRAKPEVKGDAPAPAVSDDATKVSPHPAATTVTVADEERVHVQDDNILATSSLKEAQEAKAAIAKASNSRARAEAYFNRRKDSSSPSKPPVAPNSRSVDKGLNHEAAGSELDRRSMEAAGDPVPKSGASVLPDEQMAVKPLWLEDQSPTTQALANQGCAEGTEMPQPNRHPTYEETSSLRLKSVSSGGLENTGTQIVAHPSPKTPVPPTPGQGPRARPEFVPSRGASMNSQASASLQSPRSPGVSASLQSPRSPGPPIRSQSPRSPGASIRSQSPAGSSTKSSSATSPRVEATSSMEVVPRHRVEQDTEMLGHPLASSDAEKQRLSERQPPAMTQQPSKQQQQLHQQQHQEPQHQHHHHHHHQQQQQEQQQQQPQLRAEVPGLESSEGLGTQPPSIEKPARPPPGIKISESYLEETTPHQNQAALPPMKERPMPPPSPPNRTLKLDSFNSQIPERPPSGRLPELPVQLPACDATSQQTPRAQSWSVRRESPPSGSSSSQPPHAPEPGEQLVAEHVSTPSERQQQTQHREAHLQSRDSRPSTSSASSTYYGHSMQEADALLDAEMRRRALLHGMIQLSGAESLLQHPCSSPAPSSAC